MSQPSTQSQEQETMNISSNRIRHLRHERGWSQEQLALASGLSLRTIQRVETEERASRETRVCLAATFGVALTELLDVADIEVDAQPKLSVRRYKIALAAAVVAVAPTLLGFAGVIAFNQIVSLGFMAAIGLFLYGGFGLYFTGAAAQTSYVKRCAQMAFIAAGMFCAFATFAQKDLAAVGFAAQVAALVMGVYFLFDYLRSRRQVSK
jgi:transcriptional regulator with XRE-family HTH domain